MTLTMFSKPNARAPFLKNPLHIVYCVIFFTLWLYSGITTPDYLNWLLENALTLSLIIFLVSFYNIFRFSDVSYTLIFLFLLLHMYGSHYQYTENPFGEWLINTYHFSRNHYDRIVHFSFGLLLAYPMHEVLAHGFKVNKLMSYLLPIEFTLSLSALYELLEWIVADLAFKGNEQGLDYLGAQGDIWDAQKDIALAFIGALITILIAFLIKRKQTTSS
jgi:putative membrane protein